MAVSEIKTPSNPEPGVYIWMARSGEDKLWTYYKNAHGDITSSDKPYYPPATPKPTREQARATAAAAAKLKKRKAPSEARKVVLLPGRGLLRTTDKTTSKDDASSTMSDRMDEDFGVARVEWGAMDDDYGVPQGEWGWYCQG